MKSLWNGAVFIDTTLTAVLTSEVALNNAREKITKRKVPEIEKKVAAERSVHRCEKKRHESSVSQTCLIGKAHLLMCAHALYREALLQEKVMKMQLASQRVGRVLYTLCYCI